MQIKNLSAFLSVARTLNFSEASRALNYAQSTISEQIRCLETELDTQLFERMGRRVFLTEAGKKLLPLAEKMVRNEENIRQLFQNQGRIAGPLLIGASETLCAFWLPPLLKEFCRQYPAIEPCIKVGYCTDFPEWLVQNRIDTAFSLHDESTAPHIRQHILFQGRTVFIAAPDHPLSRGTVLPITALAEQPLLLPEGETGYPMELRERLRSHGVATRTIQEFGSLDAIKQCAKNGLGISLLPEIAVKDELARGELVTFSIAGISIPLQAHMIFHQDKWLSPQLAALEMFIVEKTAAKK